MQLSISLCVSAVSIVHGVTARN